MQEFTFDTFKEYLLQQAKAKNACSEEYIKAYNSKSWSALLQVIKDNICWCYRNNILFVEIMRRLPQQVLIDNNIYVDQTQVVQRDGFAIYYNSTSEHYGNSTSGSVHVLKNVNVITDQAIVRERSTGKVYFKKNAFETVQID